MISEKYETKESLTGIVEMKENSAEGLQYLVSYLYGQAVNVDGLSCDIVVELFKTAHQYRFDILLESARNVLLSKDAEWFTPTELLELYFHVRNLDDFKDLSDWLLRIMSK